MRVTYKTSELERACNDQLVAARKYGPVSARRLHNCIKALKTFATVEALISSRIGRCHPLHGNKAGQFAMDLKHPYRLVFERQKDGLLQIAYILEVEDYH